MVAFSVAAAQTPKGTPAAPPPSQYLNNQNGHSSQILQAHEISPSLQKGLPADKQLTKRSKGLPTPQEVLNQRQILEPGATCPSINWFASKPVKLMPYLDGAFLFGNTCVEPNALIKEDPLSTGAQKLKTALSDYGLTYMLQYGFNFSDVSGSTLPGTKRSMTSHNGILLANWDIFRNKKTGSGLFLAVEVDFGEGFGYNEDEQSIQNSIGSLTSPFGGYKGPKGHLGDLSLAYTCCDGKLLVMGGMIDTTNYLDHNTYANTNNNNLVNSAFVNNIALPLTYASLGGLVAWQPNNNFYMMLSSASNYSPVNHNPFKYLHISDWSTVLEVGFVVDDVCGLGQGVYRFQPFFVTTDGQNGGGIAMNFQQALGKNTNLGWFMRAGWADNTAAKVNGVQASATTGIAWLSPFCGKGAANSGYLGLGLIWAKAPDSGANVNKNEYGVELTYVYQLTPTMTIQPDIQIIKDPINGKKNETNVVFQIQNVWTF